LEFETKCLSFESMKIYLIGMPGSGKSTLGLMLAKSLGYLFIDTDEEIVKKEKRSIEEIFKKNGENYFRKIENETLVSLSQSDNAVISTGGGVPCFFNNMEIINTSGKSIFLNVPLEALHRRLTSDKSNVRPMVAGKSPQEVMEFISNKLTERIPFYSKAQITLTGPNITLEDLKEALVTG
jgi:shikimate kinase